jgi:hypothetical protein
MTTKLPDTPSRRGLIAEGTAALLAAGAAPQAAGSPQTSLWGAPAQAAAGEDAELLRLFAQWLPLHQRYQALSRQLWDLEDQHLPTEAIDAQFDGLVPRQHALAEAIAALHAATLEGLRAKATVLLSHSGYKADGTTPEWETHDELLGWSIARDLLGDEAAKAVD